MTADDEKDPPVPADVEGAVLRRVHDGQVLPDPDDPEDPDDPQAPAEEQND